MSQIPPEIRALILDMDGVLWTDDQPIGDLPAIFTCIASLGLQVMLATNNATRSVAMFQQKLRAMGVEVQPWQIITSPQAVVTLLRQRFPQGGPVYVVGEQGLVDSLAEGGFSSSQDDVIAVVAGLDRTLTYAKLKQAARLINRGALFVATNTDATLPTPEGLIPGAGSVIAALQTATGIEPLLAGKPNPTMYQMAFERLNLPPQQVLAVGDRLETDIAGGIQAGCQTALVLSGISTSDQARDSLYPPTIISQDLAQLVGLASSHA